MCYDNYRLYSYCTKILQKHTNINKQKKTCEQWSGLMINTRLRGPVRKVTEYNVTEAHDTFSISNKNIPLSFNVIKN